MKHYASALTDKGYSHNTLAAVLTTLKNALDYAVYPSELLQTNPARLIKVPKRAPREIIKRQVIGKEKLEELLTDYPFGHPYHIMPYFNIVAETNKNTVVTEYEPEPRKAEHYQSEAELEREFIRLLCEQGYEYLKIHTEKELIENLRSQLEGLNDYKFTEDEWKRFFSQNIANPNEGIAEKSAKIQEDSVQVLKRDDGTSKNIKLIDKETLHNNRLQVINQYSVGKDEGADYNNRYDVTVLVNGFPMVHIELKRRGVAIREVFNQINRYQHDSKLYIGAF